MRIRGRTSGDGRLPSDERAAHESERPKDKERQCSARPWTEETHSRRLTTHPLATTIDRSITATYSVGGDSSKIFGQFCSSLQICSDSKISTETFRDLARNCPPCVMVLQSYCLCHRSNKSGPFRLSVILSYQTTKITKSQITNRLSHRTDVHGDSTGRRWPCTRLCWPLYTRSMSTLTKPCDIQTGPRPCGGWTNPAGTISLLIGRPVGLK